MNFYGPSSISDAEVIELASARQRERCEDGDDRHGLGACEVEDRVGKPPDEGPPYFTIDHLIPRHAEAEGALGERGLLGRRPLSRLAS